MSDLRDAWRALKSTPLVTGVAVLSLALGIGANTAIFSIVNSLLIRTLPVREPQQLVQLFNGPARSSWTNVQWEALRSHTELFSGSFAWSNSSFNLAGGGQTQVVPGIWASGDFFQVLGVQPILGRTFGPADDVRGGGPAGPVAVISYRLWQQRFGGAPDAIGKPMVIERVTYTVVGISPPDFFGPEVGRAFDIAVPIGTEPLIRLEGSALDQRQFWWLNIIGRLKPGQSLDAATSQLRGVQPQIREAARPSNQRPENAARFLADPFSVQLAAAGTSSLRRGYQQPLYILMAVVGLVLLVACANIANLLLARASARRHEMSVRMALGSSKWRIARLLLIESALLSATGATAGLLFARWGSRLLVTQLSSQNNVVFLDLDLDWRVLGFTTLAAVATTVLFGLAPALRAVRVPPMESLKEQGRTIRGESRFSLGSALVAAQVALSLVLIVAAGLFMRTFSSLATMHLGFDRDPVLVVDINARRSAPDLASRVALYGRLREAAAAVPGVSAASLSVVTPVSGSTWNTLLETVDDRTLPSNDREIYVNHISPAWFRTLGIHLAAGRDLDDRDVAGTPDVAVINQTAARKFFPGTNPLGHTLRELGNPADTPPTRTIVGVVDDAVYNNLRIAVPPTMYLAVAQFHSPNSAMSLPGIDLSLRVASGAPALLIRPVAAALEGVDKNLALSFRPLRDYIDSSLTRERLLAMLSGFFGGLALLLAALGLYGVMSYVVSRRQTEIGIRMALGATPGRVIRLVFQRVTAVLAAGVVFGTVLSLWLSKFVGSLLFGLQPRDPTTLVAAAALLAAISAVASWIPARRASRIDPTRALREG
jgi:predicted permease